MLQCLLLLPQHTSMKLLALSCLLHPGAIWHGDVPDDVDVAV